MITEDHGHLHEGARIIRELLIKAFHSVMWYTPFRRYLHYRYCYSFTPGQLSFFINCLDQTRDVPGDILEIGCAAGNTTCFLNRHLQTSGIAKNYYCIDTFSGFTPDDIAFETMNRHKKRRQFTGFRNNSLQRFQYMLRRNGCGQVRCVQTDVKKYTVSSPVSFCLLDVDLYLPTLHALRAVWPMLSPSGIIVVDDCLPKNMFDGALQAYTEFTRDAGIAPRFTLDKLGILQKPDLQLKYAAGKISAQNSAPLLSPRMSE
jgi:O-methyltransferase